MRRCCPGKLELVGQYMNISLQGQYKLTPQPVPWKMRLEIVIGMQIEILNGIMKLPFYGSFQNFKRKET